MMEFLDAPDHVLAARIGGTLTGEDYDRMIAAVEAKLAAHAKIGVFADTTGFSDITGEALVKDFRYNLSKLGQWSRFPRLAMITDKAWLRALAQGLDPLFPQFEVKIFQKGEDAAAIAWASQIPRS